MGVAAGWGTVAIPIRTLQVSVHCCTVGNNLMQPRSPNSARQCRQVNAYRHVTSTPAAWVACHVPSTLHSYYSIVLSKMSRYSSALTPAVLPCGAVAFAEGIVDVTLSVLHMAATHQPCRCSIPFR